METGKLIVKTAIRKIAIFFFTFSFCGVWWGCHTIFKRNLNVYYLKWNNLNIFSVPKKYVSHARNYWGMGVPACTVSFNKINDITDIHCIYSTCTFVTICHVYF